MGWARSSTSFSWRFSRLVAWCGDCGESFRYCGTWFPYLPHRAIARAHTRAVGGNALVSFNIQHTLFRETLKNQAYGLLSVSGDMVEGRLWTWRGFEYVSTF